MTGDKRMLLEPAHPSLSVRQQCEILGINRSSVYYVSHVNIDDEKLALIRLVDEVYTKYPFFGSRQLV